MTARDVARLPRCLAGTETYGREATDMADYDERGRWLEARYAGTCAIPECGKVIAKGSRAYWDSRDGSLTCTAVDHLEATGLGTNRSTFPGAAPVAEQYAHRVGPPPTDKVRQERPRRPSRGRGRRGYSTYPTRCTHEDFPCCGCER